MSAAARLVARIAVTRRFFAEAAESAAEVSLLMAERFARGGRLLVYGEGAQASDANHLAVEFVHPVLVGKRALPALALGADPVAKLSVLGRSDDIFLSLDTGCAPALADAALARAREQGMLTIRLSAGSQPGSPPADFLFAVPAADRMLIQEAHETLYHVLWELVQLFFEHGITGTEACSLCGDEARAATIRTVDPAGTTAEVDLDGTVRTIGLDFVEAVVPGDRVLVHQGFAISRVGP